MFERRGGATEILVVAGCLLVFGFAVRAALVTRDLRGLTRPPMTEDSYYDQSYARAIARGDFFTLNGVDVEQFRKLYRRHGAGFPVVWRLQP